MIQKNEHDIPGWLVSVLAVACGLTVANLYYAQPLLPVIAPALNIPASMASLVVTLTQLGYCAGLLFLVPLGDLVENKQLVVFSLNLLVFALVCAAIAPAAPLFMAASALIGLGAVAVQMMVPLAAHLAPAHKRGQVVGTVMSGLLLGIMLSRPVASLVTDAFDWHVLFIGSAVVAAAMSLGLRFLLPRRKPRASHSYPELIASLWHLLRDTPVLRRRAAYQAAMFAAFSLFWTAVPLELAGPTFGLSQRGIAWFALAGATGAIAAPIAGRLADLGWSRVGTLVSLLLAVVSFGVAVPGAGGSLVALVIACILLDVGVQSNLVLGQRAIFALSPEHRSRLNGLFMAIFFLGGAVGSGMAGLLLTHGGWPLVCAVGAAFPLAALCLFRVAEPAEA